MLDIQPLTRRERSQLVGKLRASFKLYRSLHGRRAISQIQAQTGLPSTTLRRFLFSPRSTATPRVLKALAIALEGWDPMVFEQPVHFREFCRDNYGVRAAMARELKVSRGTVTRAMQGLPVDRAFVAAVLQMYPGRINPQSFKVQIYQQLKGRRLTSAEELAMTILGK